MSACWVIPLFGALLGRRFFGRQAGWTALPPAIGAAPVSPREIIYQRRSAVALDGRTSITSGALYQILAKTP